MRTVRFADGTTTTQYEHRVLMAESGGRALLRSEHVHHKNGDRADNRVKKGHEYGGCPPSCCNLELKTASQHSREHALEHPAETVTLVCIVCDKPFERFVRVERYRQKRGAVGPICSKRCTGTYTHQQHPNVKSDARRKDVGHGTITMYRRGCHCDACRSANAASARAQRAQKTNAPSK